MFLKIYIYLIIFLTTSPLSSFAENYKWTATDFGTIAKFRDAHVIDFNDRGQILVSCINDSRKETIAIADSTSGMHLLPKLPIKPGTASGADIVCWQKINDTFAIGINSICIDYSYFVPQLVTWNQKQGIKIYNFPYSITSPYVWGSHVKIAKSNSEKIVVSCVDRIFLLENEKLVEITPKLFNCIKSQLLDYYKIKWEALAVNGSGIIFGKVDCFNKHPFKEQELFIKSKFFLWDGSVLKVLDVATNVEFNSRSYTFGLNNFGEAYFDWRKGIGSRTSYIWNPRNSPGELKELVPPHVNFGEMRILAVLDDETCIWGNTHGILFQDKINSYLLRFDDNASIDCGKYQGVRFLARPYLVNNQKNICLDGIFYNEEHPFLLLPVPDNDFSTSNKK